MVKARQAKTKQTGAGPVLSISDLRVMAGCGTHPKIKRNFHPAPASPDLQISSKWQNYNLTNTREEQRGGPVSSAATTRLHLMFEDRHSRAI